MGEPPIRVYLSNAPFEDNITALDTEVMFTELALGTNLGYILSAKSGDAICQPKFLEGVARSFIGNMQHLAQLHGQRAAGYGSIVDMIFAANLDPNMFLEETFSLAHLDCITSTAMTTEKTEWTRHSSMSILKERREYWNRILVSIHKMMEQGVEAYLM